MPKNDLTGVYLSTYANGQPNDNLLTLPKYPGRHLRGMRFSALLLKYTLRALDN